MDQVRGITVTADSERASPRSGPAGGRDGVRDRIVAEALALFREDGLAAVSMRKVAERAGVTAPAIYRHFRNKESLVVELNVAGLELLGRYLSQALAADTPYERLRRLTVRFLDFGLEQPHFFDLAFLSPDLDREHLAEELSRPMWGTFRLAIEQISQCMEQGELRRDDPLSTAILIWSQAYGLITLDRMVSMGPDVGAFRSLSESSIDQLFRGLREPSSGPPETTQGA